MSNKENDASIRVHPSHRISVFRKGQELFNNELFFEAHEAWEELWKLEKGDNKKFLQGLIQVCGHFVHLKKQNLSGALTQAKAAIDKLAARPTADVYLSVDMMPLLASMNYNHQILERYNPEDFPDFGKFLVPKLCEM